MSETGIVRLSFFIYDNDGEEVRVKTKIKYSYIQGTQEDEYEFDYEILSIDSADWVGEQDIREELFQWSIFDIMNPEEYNTY